MSHSKDKRQADRLHSGHLDGEKLSVMHEFPEGVVVEKRTGEKQFLPADYLRLLLLRQRGRDG